MSDNKYSENDPERTLITLDQLSQTIEVMTSVVNRLREHLSQQITAKQELEELEKSFALEKQHDTEVVLENPEQESFVVEITQTEIEIDSKDDKILH
ncbi:MAG: hypothetical protein JKY98_00050 [Gammaproteobacteria bacterium]|nr:hypothetical protein [Gammaproteobacteria bacterium]